MQVSGLQAAASLKLLPLLAVENYAVARNFLAGASKLDMLWPSARCVGKEAKLLRAMRLCEEPFPCKDDMRTALAKAVMDLRWFW